jgi:hypothetical protein
MTAEIPQFGVPGVPQSPDLRSGLAAGRPPGEAQRPGGFAPLLASALAAGNGGSERDPGVFPALRAPAPEAAPQPATLPAAVQAKPDGGPTTAPLLSGTLSPAPAAPGVNPETRRPDPAGIGKPAEIRETKTQEAKTQEAKIRETETQETKTQEANAATTPEPAGAAASARQAALEAPSATRTSAPSSVSPSVSPSPSPSSPLNGPASPEDSPRSGHASVPVGPASSGSGKAVDPANRTRGVRSHRSARPAPAVLPGPSPLFAGASGAQISAGQTAPAGRPTAGVSSAPSAAQAPLVSAAAASSVKDAASPGGTRDSGNVSPGKEPVQEPERATAAVPQVGKRDGAHAGEGGKEHG